MKENTTCCNHCEYDKLVCCDAPDRWELEPAECEFSLQPDVEAILRESEKLKAENRKLRTIVSTVEAFLGRKIDV